MTGQTVPKEIKLVDTGNDTWLAADRGGSKFNGIIIDPIDKEVVSSLLRDNGSEFVRAWDVYAQQRGWQYLLVDIWKLASANRKCRGLDLGRLAIVADAFQVMHNRYQAELMAQADEVFPGRVFFIQGKHQAAAHGDFAIRTETTLKFEIKTIHTTATVELRRTGFSIAEATVRKITKDLCKKATDGLTQLGGDGTVICAIWCDIIGAAFAAAMAEFEIALHDVFMGRTLLIGARDENGSDRWFGFRDGEQWERGLERLATTLPKLRRPSLQVGLANVKWGGNSEEWEPISKMVTIDGSKQMDD